MWPFRRNRDAAAARAPEPAATGPVHRAGPAAWRAAPPLPVVQTSRTTIDPAFVSRLATRADPSFLGALGHHVVDAAPAGAVHGLAVAEHGPRSFAPPPGGGSTAQRLIADPGPATAPGPSARPTADVTGVAGAPAAMAVPLAATARQLVDASAVDLPAVPARAAVQLRPVPDAAASTGTPPPGPAEMTEAETTTTGPDAPAAPADATATASAAPIAPTVGTTSAAPRPASSPAPTASIPPVVSRVIDTSPAPARPRPRIGAPIDRPGPSTAGPAPTPGPVVQRRADAPPDLTHDRPAGPADTGAGAGDAGLVGDGAAGLVGERPLGPQTPEVMSGGGAASVRPGDLAVPTVAGGPATAAAGTSPTGATSGPTSTTPSVASAAAPATRRAAPIGPPVQRHTAEPTVSPTVGVEPLTGGPAIGSTAKPDDGPPAMPTGQRSPRSAPSAAAPGPTGPPPPAVGTAAAAVPTVLRELIGSPMTGTAAPAGGPRVGGDGPGSPGAATGPVGSRRPPIEGATVALPTVVRPAVQLVPLVGDRPVAAARGDAVGAVATIDAIDRPVVATPPVTGATPSSPRSGPPVAAAGSSALTVVSRSASMPASVSRLVEAASASPSVVATSSSTPVAAEASSAPDPPIEHSVPAWVQRAEEPAGAPTPPTTDVTPSAAVAVDTGDTGPREPSAAEIDRLAQALYPQLRRRLGRDLLLDRERLGYRTDIRF